MKTDVIICDTKNRVTINNAVVINDMKSYTL